MLVLKRLPNGAGHDSSAAQIIESIIHACISEEADGALHQSSMGCGLRPMP